MDRLKYIVKREFGDIIRQNSWLDDSLDFLFEALDHLDRHEYDLAMHKRDRAKQSIDIWYKACTCLPEKTKRAIAEGLKLIYDEIFDLSHEPENEPEVDELITASYELIELAKMVSIIARWEKIRDKIDRQLLNANAF